MKVGGRYDNVKEERRDYMKFETLKKRHLKRSIIIGIGVVLILVTLILTFSRARYRIEQSIPLVNGTINYSASDLNVIAITVNGEKVDTLPTGNYTLTDNSYCEIDGEKAEVTLNWDSTSQVLSITPFTTKGTKCYLDFTSPPSSNAQILATINGSASGTFPSKTSNYTPDSVTCTNGAKAKFDYVDWAVEIDSMENTTCTVNFKTNINQSFASYLTSKVCSTTPTTDDAAKDCLVNENGYRYEGKNPNNYVLFNDELWRIIGVFSVQTQSSGTQNLVKLIRNETLDELAWDGRSSGSTSDWSASTLQSHLNNGYYNATDTTCNFYSSNTKTCYFSNTGLNSSSREMVESVVWNLGGTSSTRDVTADTFYTVERGNTVPSGNPTTWTGKVALMYPSDYGYAVLASSCARTTNLDDYGSTACAGNNWLKGSYTQWTLTNVSGGIGIIFYVKTAGDLYYYGVTKYSNGVRPSIYLKSNIAVMGGDGSIDTPYIIE